MGATAAVHPADPILQAYGLGKLDDVSSASVSQHVEGCDSCRRRVAELSSGEFPVRAQQANVVRDKAASDWSPSPGSSTDGTARPFAPPPVDTLPPELVDHPDWEVVRELGRGGMGVVYLANNRLMGRPEVLKVVGRHLIERPGVLERFLREIQSAARLQHTNIVTAYTASRLGQSVVLAMEFVDGLDLAKMVKTKGPLPVAHACSFIHQAALGLQHAHERGMVHRDIKPANLILARDGKKAIVKVLDFGLAKVTSEGETDSNLTREGQMVGTPDFIAPEQIRDSKSADIRADIYSLGCTLYYLLTGGPPFRGEHVWDVYQAHFSMDASPLNQVRPDVPAELTAVVAKMMAKEPGQRFQTPGAVALALTPFFKAGSMQPAIPATASTPAAPRPPKTGTDGVAWESLIAIKEDASLIDAAKPKRPEPQPALAETPVRRPTWKSWPLMAAAAVFGFVVLGIVIYISTDKGRIKADLGDGNSPVKIEAGKGVVEYKPKVSNKGIESRVSDSSRPGRGRELADASRTVDVPKHIAKTPAQHQANDPQRPGAALPSANLRMDPFQPNRAPGDAAARNIAGKANNALSFDGRTSVAVARSRDFDMTSRDYSIFARIKTRRGGTIFSKAAARSQWVPDGKALFVRGGSLVFDIGWVDHVASSRKINDDVWHEVGMTFTHNNRRVALYIDGKLEGQKPLAPKKDAPDHVVRIGFTSAGFPNPTYFDGAISEVRFYQWALSREQIAMLATNEPDGKPPVAHWRLDPLYSAAIRDETGRGHDGTPSVDAGPRAPEKTGPAPAPAQATPSVDPFQAGSIWTGMRRFASGKEQACELKITARETSKFRGELTLLFPQDQNPRFTLEVNGNVNGKTVTFENQKREQFHQVFSGVRAGRELRLEFSGTGRNGPSVAGNATLMLKESRAAETPKPASGPMEEIARVPIRPFHNVLAFSPDNERVAIDNFWNIKLVDLKTGNLIRDIAPGRPLVGNFNCVMSAHFAPDGAIIASYEGQTIRIWDRNGASKIRDLGSGPQGDQFRDINYSGPGKWVIGRSQTEIRFWDLETGTEKTRYPMASPVKSLDVHPNGRWIVSIHRDNVIRTWDARTREPVSEFPDGTKKVARVRFSPAGRQLLCLPQGLPVFSIVNPENGEVIQVFQGPLTNVLDAAFFPSGRRVASINADNILRVWSVATGEQLYSKAFDKEARRIGISPGGDYVVVMVNGEAIVYRVRS